MVDYNTNVTLPSYESGPTLIMSSKKAHLRYNIHNPTLEWACYNYIHAQHGSIYKYQFKVLMFFHPNLAKGIIAHFKGSLKGISVQRGLQNLFSPHVGTPPPPPPHIMTNPHTSICKLTTPIQLNLKEHLRNMHGIGYLVS
jgi:hypothetical protein